MPITQDRMAAVITAGLDYQQALKKTIILINQAADRDTTANPELLYLQRLCYEAGLLAQPTESPMILASEEKHYRQQYSKNAQKKAKAALKRRARGIKPRLASARSLTPLSELIKGPSVTDKIKDTIRDQSADEILHQKHAGIPAHRAAQIIQEAEDELELNRMIEERNKPKAPEYSAFDPPDDHDDSQPLISAPDNNEENEK